MTCVIDRGPYTGEEIELPKDLAEGKETLVLCHEMPMFFRLETRDGVRVAVLVGTP